MRLAIASYIASYISYSYTCIIAMASYNSYNYSHNCNWWLYTQPWLYMQSAVTHAYIYVCNCIHIICNLICTLVVMHFRLKTAANHYCVQDNQHANARGVWGLHGAKYGKWNLIHPSVKLFVFQISVIHHYSSTLMVTM